MTVRIFEVNHEVRIVALWRYRQDAEPVKILVTNRITWEVSRVVRVYRHRWTGTETFHRDGKQHVGLGDCWAGSRPLARQWFAFAPDAGLMERTGSGCRTARIPES